MGKRRRLRSSIKDLHEALANLTPRVTTLFCVQPVKTHSFRDLVPSFNYVYHTPPSSNTSSHLCSQYNQRHSPQNGSPTKSRRVKTDGEVNEEVVSNFAVTSRATTSSSSLSNSCIALANSNAGVAADTVAFPLGTISSKRFFFSPCNSKSITAEEHKVGLSETPRLSCDSLPGADEAESENVLEEPATSMTGESLALRWASMPVAMASRNPYRDFSSSMEEMVAAHCLWDWSDLKELLHCYLRLNERKTHKVIMLAFVDLIMQLISQGKIHAFGSHGAVSELPLPSSCLSPRPHSFP